MSANPTPTECASKLLWEHNKLSYFHKSVENVTKQALVLRY